MNGIGCVLSATALALMLAGCGPSQTPQEAKQAETDALFAAIEERHALKLEHLLEQGADPNVVCGADTGDPGLKHTGPITPLRAALGLHGGEKPPRMARALLEHGADPKVADKRGTTPLHLAADRWGRDLGAALIERGADVNARDEEGVTPLHRAARGGNLELVELLIARGADVNAKTVEQPRDPNEPTIHVDPGRFGSRGIRDYVGPVGQTPLLYGICQPEINNVLGIAEDWRRKTELVELLVAKGARVDEPCAHGSTPLVAAAFYDQGAIIEILLAAGADASRIEDHLFAALVDTRLSEKNAALLRAAREKKPDAGIQPGGTGAATRP